jgi:copper chaperone
MKLQVQGMTCDHCVHAVTEELMEVAQVTGVQIDLVPGGASTVLVDLAGDVDVGDIRAAITEAGYELIN